MGELVGLNVVGADVGLTNGFGVGEIVGFDEVAVGAGDGLSDGIVTVVRVDVGASDGFGEGELAGVEVLEVGMIVGTDVELSDGFDEG